ncbi:META domain-containing protein [Sphingomonas daechungensis]|uniref:META domain-containing protein n=1 Tax=Sphingomonas daechungensis TaxID=1176646 RepID=A0ABX6SY44_9SPHN|nr:META domain-containing protein [Sphingomonas daechungensis]
MRRRSRGSSDSCRNQLARGVGQRPPTPQQGDYFVQFDADRVSAKFGCNSMSGGYSVGGDTLNVGAMAMTRKFCPEPAMSFENQGAKILGQPVTMKPNGDRLTLSNSAGTIELRQTF